MDNANSANVNQPSTSTIITQQIAIEGMTCDKCVARVDKALRSIPGAESVQVDRQAALAAVTFDSTRTNIAALHESLLAAGYKPASKTN